MHALQLKSRKPYAFAISRRRMLLLIGVAFYSINVLLRDKPAIQKVMQRTTLPSPAPNHSPTSGAIELFPAGFRAGRSGPRDPGVASVSPAPCAETGRGWRDLRNAYTPGPASVGSNIIPPADNERGGRVRADCRRVAGAASARREANYIEAPLRACTVNDNPARAYGHTTRGDAYPAPG
jgi:hypothetical protein